MSVEYALYKLTCHFVDKQQVRIKQNLSKCLIITYQKFSLEPLNVWANKSKFYQNHYGSSSKQCSGSHGSHTITHVISPLMIYNTITSWLMQFMATLSDELTAT